MTPLIDVMLVLLVIFIVTAPLMVTAVNVNLPQLAGTPTTETPRFITLALDKNGQAYLADQPMTLPALAQALKKQALQNPLTEVQLRADTTVPYGRVVELMGLAQEAGLSRLGFVAQTEPKPAPQ